MKKQKISFSSIKDVLNRDEMRSIMAGSGSSQCSTSTCSNSNGTTTNYCYSDPHDGLNCNCVQDSKAIRCPGF